MNPLGAFFAARHVVFVGASRTPGRLGHTLAHNLVSRGFQGRIDFVNPHGGDLFDRPIRPSLREVSGNPDLAVLLVPAGDVPGLIVQCAARGIRQAIVASGGFSESGPEGEALERSLRDVSARLGVRVVGPNCVGLVDTGSGLDTSFLGGTAVPPGGVAFISHSGAICASMIEWARDSEFGISRLVSLGNQVDLDESDALDMIADDPRTNVIGLYLERVGDGRRFMEVCDRISRIKPIVALKAGRSAAGRRAASSHTGALAGQDVAFDAAFRACGVLRAETTEDLVDAARVLSRFPRAASRRLAILTNAGGPGVTAADAAEASGLTVEPLSLATREALRRLLPAEASVSNPVDMLASASPESYGGALRCLLQDPEIDCVVVLLPPPPTYPAELAAEAILSASLGQSKPVVAALLGSAGVASASQLLASGGVPVFRYPEHAVRALAWLERARSARERPLRVRGGSAVSLEPFAHALAHEWLSSSAALSVIGSLGIAIPGHAVVRSAQEAPERARAIGFPVVLKVDSSAIVHKSDVGGVALGLANEDAVRGAYEEMNGRLMPRDDSGADEGAHFEALVQAMAPPGVDLIVGMVRDPSFGPLVMIGTGGVDVELTRDVAFAPLPLSSGDVTRLMLRTGAGRLLSAHRGRAAVDPARIVHALLRLADLAEAADFVAEVEINPLRVAPSGDVMALDARIRIDPATTDPTA